MIHQSLSATRQIYPNIQAKTKSVLDKLEFSQQAGSSLEVQSHLGDNINLNIDHNESRSSMFTKYVVYHITGVDKNGPINVFRRFNQFYKMRGALIKRFPGCFIPSIPEKSISLIDDEIVNKRQRYLNDFLKRMASLPHLYHSEQFQALLRSPQKDLSGTFERWPNPTTAEIINKYKANFSHLSGKIIDTAAKANIIDFIKNIGRTNVYLYKFKIQIKSLAAVRDQFDQALAPFFSKSLPSFEKECLTDCVRKEQELISTNSAPFFKKNINSNAQIFKENPYWLFYDLIKLEQRDGCAFLQCTKAIEDYEDKYYQIQMKLGENSKSIAQINMGKKSNSQLKYKLQVQNEILKKEKEAIQCLTDIITALIVFVEMDRFKKQKSEFYLNVLMKVGSQQINQLQSLNEIWLNWKQRTQTLLSAFQEK